MTEIWEKLTEFWELTVDVWNNGVFGHDFGRVLIALGILSFFIILRNLFARGILSGVARFLKRRGTEFSNLVVDAIEPPVRLIPVIVGVFFTLEYLDFDGTLNTISDDAVRSLVVIAMFWAFYRLVKPLSITFDRLNTLMTPAMLGWLINFLRVALVVIAVATILELWGIAVAPIIAGFGLLGVAVALGAQDLFKNLIAGVLILSERRFNVGDWINVDGVVEGTVKSIGFRSTLVRRFDRAPVYVPNAKLSDNAVTNFSAMTHRRIYWLIGVEYRTTTEQLRKIRDEIEEYILSNEDFASPEEVSTFVRIDKFNDSSIDILLYCFTRSTNWGEWLQIKEELAYKIKEVVEGAGTGFAFPSQSLYLEKLPGDQKEVFLPPTTPPAQQIEKG